MLLQTKTNRTIGFSSSYQHKLTTHKIMFLHKADSLKYESQAFATKIKNSLMRKVLAKIGEEVANHRQLFPIKVAKSFDRRDEKKAVQIGLSERDYGNFLCKTKGVLQTSTTGRKHLLFFEIEV